MPKKVHEAQGDQRFAALPQNLGGSGTIDGSAAAKMGLLTKSDSQYLALDQQGSLELPLVGNISLSPVSDKKHYIGEEKQYRVFGCDSVQLSNIQQDLQVTVDGLVLTVVSSAPGAKTFNINGSVQEVVVEEIVPEAPILAQGRDRIVTVNQRSINVALDLSNQPVSLVNDTVSVEWDVRDHQGNVVENLLASGTTYLCVIPAEGQYRIIRARINLQDGTKSPWSNAVTVDFYPLSSWVQDPVNGGARYGCFADNRIIIDSNYGREANLIDFTELNKETKNILRTIEKPIDSATFMVNPHEGPDGDIISVCYGKGSQTVDSVLPWGFEGELCIFNYLSDGYNKEQALESSNLALLKSSSRKAQKFPRLQKDGVIYKVDPTVLALSKNGTRVTGSFYGEDGRFSGIYTYKRISTGSYIQEEFLSGIHGYDVDVSEDGKTILHFDGVDRKNLVIARKIDDDYINSSIDFSGFDPNFIPTSVRFTSDENFVVVYGVSESIGHLHLIDIRSEQIVSSITVSYSVTNISSISEQFHRIRASLDRKTFVISTGGSFTCFRVKLDSAESNFEILRIGSGIDVNTGRISKVRNDGKVLLNIVEPTGIGAGLSASGNSKFAYQFLDILDHEDNPIYPKYVLSLFKRNDIPSGFIEKNPVLRLSVDEVTTGVNKNLEIIVSRYVDPQAKKFFFRLMTVNMDDGSVISDVLLKDQNGNYFSYLENSEFDGYSISYSRDLRTVCIFDRYLIQRAGHRGGIFIFRDSGAGYVHKALPGLNTATQLWRGACFTEDGSHVIATHETAPYVQVYKLNSSGDYYLALNADFGFFFSHMGISVKICGDETRSDIIDIVSVSYGGVSQTNGRFSLNRYNVSQNVLNFVAFSEIDSTVPPYPQGYIGHEFTLSSDGRLLLPQEYTATTQIESMHILEITGTGFLKTYLKNRISDEELLYTRGRASIFFDPIRNDCFYTISYISGKWHLNNYRYVSQGNIAKLSTKTLGTVRSLDSLDLTLTNFNVVDNKLIVGSNDPAYKTEKYVFELD